MAPEIVSNRSSALYPLAHSPMVLSDMKKNLTHSFEVKLNGAISNMKGLVSRNKAMMTTAYDEVNKAILPLYCTCMQNMYVYLWEISRI